MVAQDQAMADVREAAAAVPIHLTAVLLRAQAEAAVSLLIQSAIQRSALRRAVFRPIRGPYPSPAFLVASGLAAALVIRAPARLVRGSEIGAK